MSNLEKFVNETINENKVAIFSKSYCPYCKMAKEVFKNIGESFAAIELNNRDDGDEIQSFLHGVTGSRTVPQVFINGKYVGGGTDVKEKHESGELKKLFQSAA